MQADLAMNPPGAGLIAVFHRPLVTRYDLFSAMPFHNRAVVALMSGAQIRRGLSDQPDTVVVGDVAQLADARTYRVAMVDFVASSVFQIPSLRVVEQGPDVRLAVADYIRLTTDHVTRTKPIGASDREERTSVRARRIGGRRSGVVASAAGHD
jgi:2',3'-cyclic-nucleotide 2'-phosphodiesterase (5'-nucleotidase family)